MKSLLTLFMTAILCSCRTSPTRLEGMTDKDLQQLVKQNIPFGQFEYRLGLETYEYKIMENGSVDMRTCRFEVGDRYLFMEVDNTTEIVTRAFFVPVANARPLIYPKPVPGVASPKPMGG